MISVYLMVVILAGPNYVMLLVCRTQANLLLLPQLLPQTLVLQLLPRKKRRRRKSLLRSRMMTWVSACLTRVAQIVKKLQVLAFVYETPKVLFTLLFSLSDEENYVVTSVTDNGILC